MELVVLNVAYPFAPVGAEMLGDAERTVSQLDAALVHAGHESFVMACEGSSAQGILLATPGLSDLNDVLERQRIYEQYRFTLRSFLEKWPIDLIHMHGMDFYEYLPPAGVPVLVTLHSRLDQYPESIFRIDRPQTFLQCISTEQRNVCPPCANLLPETEFSPEDVLRGLSHLNRGVMPTPVERYLSLYERLVDDARTLESIVLGAGSSNQDEMVQA